MTRVRPGSPGALLLPRLPCCFSTMRGCPWSRVATAILPWATLLCSTTSQRASPVHTANTLDRYQFEFLGRAGPFDKGQQVETTGQMLGTNGTGVLRVNGTVGGFSGLAFDPSTADEWWVISDRGGKLWKVALDLSRLQRPQAEGNGSTGSGGRGAIRWLRVVQLRGAAGDVRCPPSSAPHGACTRMDAEGVAAGCTGDDTMVLVSTEGPAAVLGVDHRTGALRYGNALNLSGGERAWARLPCTGAGAGERCPPAVLRDNKMLESLTCARGDATHPRVVITGAEEPPLADGPAPTSNSSGSTRVWLVDPLSGRLLRSVRYELAPMQTVDGDATALVDLEAIVQALPGSSAPQPFPAGQPGSQQAPPPQAMNRQCGPART